MSTKARRVSWRNLREIEEIYVWIYADNNTQTSKQKAVNRLAAWQTVTPLPPALESTLLLLTANLLDYDSGSSRSQASQCLAIRGAYNTALVRMVNGVVDPLQVGLFARSIASIAAQLDLPPWLVELRHAGTHEDLPSLDLLRRGAIEAFSWIESNFFIPLLTSTQLPAKKQELPSPEPWLYEYKTLYRRIVLNNTPRSRLDSDFLRLEKQLEKWLAKLKLFSPDYALSALYGSQETADIFPLGELSNALLDSRCLLSKRLVKLSSDENSNIPENLAVWSKLLVGIQEKHPAFAQTFIFTVLERLSHDLRLETEERAAMVGWVRWIVMYLLKDPTELGTLISGLLGREFSSEGESEILAETLRRFPLPAGQADDLVRKLTTKRPDEWKDSQLYEMTERMELLQHSVHDRRELDEDEQSIQATQRRRINGWHQLESGGVRLGDGFRGIGGRK